MCIENEQKLDEPTLLNHLLNYYMNPKEYLDILDNLAEAEASKKYWQEHPKEIDAADVEELSFIDADIEMYEEDLLNMQDGWKPDEIPNMSEEIDIIKKWVQEHPDLVDD